MKRVLVVANETVAGRPLIEAVKKRADGEEIRAHVISPQNQPKHGYVIYDEHVRDAAQNRLEMTVALLREAGIEADGEVMDPDPYAAVMDALGEHDYDEIIISTHPGELKSSWLRANLIERARKVTDKPVDHVVVDLESARERAHVLVLANQTVLGQPLVDAIHERSAASPAEFTLLIPADAVGAERRLTSICRLMADAGIEATGRLGDPDPVVSVENAIHDEQFDEVIVSTFPEATSGWLRRGVLGRIRSFGLPVTHVVVTQQEAEAAEESAVA